MLPFGPPFQLIYIKVVTERYGIRREVLLGMSWGTHWEIVELDGNRKKNKKILPLPLPQKPKDKN
jgi:hypothetical protein